MCVCDAWACALQAPEHVCCTAAAKSKHATAVVPGSGTCPCMHSEAADVESRSQQSTPLFSALLRERVILEQRQTWASWGFVLRISLAASCCFEHNGCWWAQSVLVSTCSSSLSSLAVPISFALRFSFLFFAPASAASGPARRRRAHPHIWTCSCCCVTESFLAAPPETPVPISPSLSIPLHHPSQLSCIHILRTYPLHTFTTAPLCNTYLIDLSLLLGLLQYVVYRPFLSHWHRFPFSPHTYYTRHTTVHSIHPLPLIPFTIIIIAVILFTVPSVLYPVHIHSNKSITKENNYKAK